MDHEATNPVRAVQHTCEIIAALESGPKWFAEILDTVSIGKGPVHNHLATLQEEGYVIKIGDKYRLSRRFLELGGRARHRHPLYEDSKQRVKALSEETGELASFMIEEEGRGVRWIQYQGTKAVKTDIHVGQYSPLHATALGKAILAKKPEEWVDTVIDHHGLSRETEATITDRDELFAELESVREHGVATDEGEFMRGLRCVAAPVVFDEEGRFVGAIGVTAPSSRLSVESLENEVADQVKAKANLIEIENTRTVLR
jgi:DNA-binding IclR family transcriptional regulator